jgi:hypothetical protein
MPTVSVYPAGGTTHMPANTGSHTRAKRGQIKGWSPSTTRRLTKWLYSVEADRLTGQGYALTLTMRDTPPDRASLDRAFRALVTRYERRGVVRLQWVMEMQRRGTPHFHMALYTPEPLPLGGQELVSDWLELAEPWGVLRAAQRVEPLQKATGWLQYLSKHASRSVAHYQRQGMPPGWEKTGRLWGVRGDWPTADEPMRFDLSRDAWFRYRRLVRAYRLADARKERDPKRRADRIVSARRMLAHHDRKVSEVRGTSEWVPQHVQVAWLGLLSDQGHGIHQQIPETAEDCESVRRGAWIARERWRKVA